MRELTYAEAIGEATVQMMDQDPSIFVMGPGVGDSKGIFGTTKPAHYKYPTRVFDTPLSENMLTGACIGAAVTGMRPMLVHARNDFMLLTLDQLLNNAAKWEFMSGGKLRNKVSIVIRALIGRGWGQGPQHSQALHATLSHIPGLTVVMPANAIAAKGLLCSALSSNRPVVFLEHRSLYERRWYVPDLTYYHALGQAQVLRHGKDTTIVAVSAMVSEAITAAVALMADHGIDAEVIDLQTASPWDKETVLESFAKTRSLVVADVGHMSFGLGRDIIATCEGYMNRTRMHQLVASPDHPCPTNDPSGRRYYPDWRDIVKAVLTADGRADQMIEITEETPIDAGFTGPF
jgi:pyruvate/2-oxoglutarate/acetoin dehydrogenase E1 component